METVARTALDIQPLRVSKATLLQTGWRDRLAGGDDGLSEIERGILRVVRSTATPVGITEIALRTGRPARTLLRHLAGLVREGRVVRHGRGRATRYRLPRVNTPIRA